MRDKFFKILYFAKEIVWNSPSKAEEQRVFEHFKVNLPVGWKVSIKYGTVILQGRKGNGIALFFSPSDGLNARQLATLMAEGKKNAMLRDEGNGIFSILSSLSDKAKADMLVMEKNGLGLLVTIKGTDAEALRTIISALSGTNSRSRALIALLQE